MSPRLDSGTKKKTEFVYEERSKDTVTGCQRTLLTIDYSGHPPESQQDEKTNPIKRVFMEEEGNIQHKGHNHHQTVKHLKLVIKKLQAISKKLPSQLHHEERHQSQAQVMKDLQQRIVMEQDENIRGGSE